MSDDPIKKTADEVAAILEQKRAVARQAAESAAQEKERLIQEIAQREALFEAIVNKVSTTMRDFSASMLRKRTGGVRFERDDKTQISLNEQQATRVAYLSIRADSDPDFGRSFPIASTIIEIGIARIAPGTTASDRLVLYSTRNQRDVAYQRHLSIDPMTETPTTEELRDAVLKVISDVVK